jgi:2-methylcitrate dehydratase PrpD
MPAIEAIAEFVAGHRPDAPLVDQVRLHVADTIGAWIAAARTREGRALIGFRPEDAPLFDRVANHCALARLSEVDDIHLAAMITPGAIVVPAAMVMASSLPGADAGELGAAIVAGYEAMIRLGAAIDGPTVLYRGIWPSYFAAPFGVAAAAARLLRLDPERTAHALATALIMATPGTGHHAAPTTARWLAAGYAAARGLQAAQAAQAGFTSDVRIADGDFLRNVYGLAPDLGILGAGLGAPALAQVSFKPWCAARQTMAATQALREILADGVQPESIARIGVAVLPPHLRMIDHGVTPGDRFSYLTSLPYQMAVAALEPDAAYELGGPTGPLSHALGRFMANIKVRGEDALLTAGYPRAWPAHVTVTTASGRHERTVTAVPGDPARPFGAEELRAKFRRVTAAALDQASADAMFERALGALGRPAELVGEIERIGNRG